MKKFFFISIVAVICIGSTYTAYADSSGQNTTSGNTVAPLPYTPLEPLPFVTQNTNGKVNQVKDFPAIVNGFFKLILAFGAAFAVVTLVFYGISYMTSEVAGKKTEAKNRVQAAIFGLILLLGAYIILNTINPNLLKIGLFLPTITAPGAPSQTSNQSTCNEYGVSTLCADGNNNYIEQQIVANGICQQTLEAGAATCPPETPSDLEYLAEKQLEADHQECQTAYHGAFGQASDSSQNCSTWDKQFTDPKPVQFNSCIAVPDPKASTPDTMSWWVCGYNQ